MAIISSFRKLPRTSGRLHRTHVECGYVIFDAGGKRFLQLETYGSDERQIPGKVSQTLQLDEDAAMRLAELIRRAFD